MDILQELFASVDNQMFTSFTCKFIFTEKNIKMDDYKSKFISTFVNMDTRQVNTKIVLHKCVDQTSLCTEEVIFFHFLIDYEKEPENFISTLIKYYETHANLQKCQLAKCIKKCLDYSTSLVIVA